MKNFNSFLSAQIKDASMVTALGGETGGGGTGPGGEPPIAGTTSQGSGKP